MGVFQTQDIGSKYKDFFEPLSPSDKNALIALGVLAFFNDLYTFYLRDNEFGEYEDASVEFAYFYNKTLNSLEIPLGRSRYKFSDKTREEVKNIVESSFKGVSALLGQSSYRINIHFLLAVALHHPQSYERINLILSELPNGDIEFMSNRSQELCDHIQKHRVYDGHDLDFFYKDITRRIP